ncbi:MAG: LLM class flavin-dependent oxidoreductase [Paracoccaceae bacterium]|nr:LLM class flavin-dependent oxidoreductase [Paracoccaceae bacterium]
MDIGTRNSAGVKFGVGLGMMNSGVLPEVTLYADAVDTAELAESLRFHSVWTVEHHFTGHSPVPNGLTFLSHLAGRTKNLMLGTAVLVLPWHDPVRVAEEIAMLDLLSGGRTLIGLGRGTSPQEYAGFGIPMSESRERFTEAVQIVRLGLSGERFSFDGAFRQVRDLQIRPLAQNRPETRMYGAASSETSAAALARLGLGMMVSPGLDLAKEKALLDYHAALCEARRIQVPKPMSHLYISVAETRDDAMARAEHHVPLMMERLDKHYGISNHSLKGVKGYEDHARKSWNNDSERAQAERGFIDKQLIGTPGECIDRIKEIVSTLGIEHFVVEFGYGAMRREDTQANIRLFAQEIMPAFDEMTSKRPVLRAAK